MMANLKLNELFRRILPNTRREQVRQDAPSSQTLTRALAPVLAFWVQYRGQILGWLKPFWNYYQMRTRREQILLATGAVAFGLWMIYTLILTPYIEMRRGVQTAYDQAYAEYPLVRIPNSAAGGVIATARRAPRLNRRCDAFRNGTFRGCSG